MLEKNIVSMLKGPNSTKTGRQDAVTNVGETNEEISVDSLNEIKRATRDEVQRIQSSSELVFSESLMGDDAWD